MEMFMRKNLPHNIFWDLLLSGRPLKLRLCIYMLMGGSKDQFGKNQQAKNTTNKSAFPKTILEFIICPCLRT